MGLFIYCLVKGELLRCNKKVDLAILLDSSASLSDEDFETAKRFAKELTKRFTLDKNRTRLSVVSFSHYKKIPFKFQDFYSQEKVFKAVDEFYHEASTSLLGGALAVVQNGVFNVKYGSRPKRKGKKTGLNALVHAYLNLVMVVETTKLRGHQNCQHIEWGVTKNNY